jgi:hypothetical protein
MVRGPVLLALVAGCGRIGFDPLPPVPLPVASSNIEPGDNFGYAVALSQDGTTMAVGAWAERSGARGVDGDQSDNSVPEAGAVYVFVRDAAGWTQQAYLKASNTGIGLDLGDSFGWNLAISGDGDLIAVGAPLEDSSPQGEDTVSAAGAVYMFRRTGASWQQEAFLKASNPRQSASFGNNVALSLDGTRLAVGAPLEPSPSTGIDGDQTSSAAPDAGAVYVFRRDATSWTQEAYVKQSNTNAGDSFGAVSLSADGSTLAVGATGEASSTGDQTDNAAPYAGAVYIFVRTGTTWTQQAYVKPPVIGADDGFGAIVWLSSDGSTLAAATGDASAATGVDGNAGDNSAADAGAVYLFERTGTTWNHAAYIKPSNTDAGDAFGSNTFDFYGGNAALSGDGSALVVCSGAEDSASLDPADNTASNAGACYRFARSGASWQQTAYIKALVPEAEARFGTGMALSADGHTLAVGAPEAVDAAGAVTVFGL